MALNMKKTIKPRGASTSGGHSYVEVPSGVMKPAGTKGGSAAGMIDKPMPTNTGGGSKGKGRKGGSIKSRMRPKGRGGVNY